MAKSILQKERVCFFCGSRIGLEEHHVFGGTANRKKSEKWGLTIWVCHKHHTDPIEGVQYNKERNRSTKRLAQIAFEARHSHELFMSEFGKNYL